MSIDLIIFPAIILVMYFFMLRPKIKEQKEMDKMLSALKKGDKVLTGSGMYGEVAALKDDNIVTLKFGDVKIDFNKSSITRIVGDKSEKQTDKAMEKKG